MFFLPFADAGAIRFKRRATLGLVVPDPELGHALKASHDRAYEWRGLRYATHQAAFPGQERLGYRIPDGATSSAAPLGKGGRPSSGDGAPLRADIAALGDSFTLGMEVDAGSTWASLLGRMSGLRVANLGVPSYGTTQERLLFSRYGRRLKPRLVVLLLATNDPRDNYVFDSWRRQSASREGAAGDFIHYKFCLGLGLQPGKACGVMKFLMTRCGAAVNVALTQLATAWMNLVHGGEDFDAGMGLLCEDLRALRAETAASGARLMVLLHPNWSDPRWGKWHPRAYPRVLKTLRREGIPYFDLSEPVRRYPGVRIGIPLDGHWNEAGHALVAAELSRFLASRGLLPPAARTARKIPR